MKRRQKLFLKQLAETGTHHVYVISWINHINFLTQTGSVILLCDHLTPSHTHTVDLTGLDCGIWKWMFNHGYHHLLRASCQGTMPSPLHTSLHLLSIIPLGPIFHIRKLQLREVKVLAQSHTAYQQQGSNRNPRGFMGTGVSVYHPILLPVFVLLPWCEGWGAAPGGGLTAPIGP